MITVNEDIEVELGHSVEAEAELSLFASIVGGVNDGIDGGTADQEFPEPTTDPLTVQIQMRRDTQADWIDANPTLRRGEWGYVTDGKFMVMGNGTDNYVALVADSSNVYSPKSYIDYWIDQVFDTFNDLYVSMIITLNDLTDRVSALEAAMSLKPSYAINVSPLSPVYDGSNRDYQTPSEYVPGTLMVYKGGTAGMALCQAYIEVDSQNFTMDKAPEVDDVLILMYEKR